jgi:hypothetical protein
MCSLPKNGNRDNCLKGKVGGKVRIRRLMLTKALSGCRFLFSQRNSSLNEEFERMPFDHKLSYLIANRNSLPDELTSDGVEVLVQAGEIEYAVVLARDKGMIDKAIQILVDAGDYLWAALIAKNAKRDGESERLYREGLQYYIDMEMFGRAISAATALGLPQDEVDELFQRGIVSESQGLDLAHARDMIDCALESLDIAIIGKDDEVSRQVLSALTDEREKILKGDQDRN